MKNRRIEVAILITSLDSPTGVREASSVDPRCYKLMQLQIEIGFSIRLEVLRWKNRAQFFGHSFSKALNWWGYTRLSPPEYSESEHKFGNKAGRTSICKNAACYFRAICANCRTPATSFCKVRGQHQSPWHAYLMHSCPGGIRGEDKITLCGKIVKWVKFHF